VKANPKSTAKNLTGISGDPTNATFLQEIAGVIEGL